MLPRPVRFLPLAPACATLLGCVARPRQIKTNAFEYLYPSGSPTQPATDVTLRLPVRVGIAFAPAKPQSGDTFTEEQKRQLLERVASSFRGREGIAGVDVLPSSLLKAGGGFDEIDRLRQANGSTSSRSSPTTSSSSPRRRARRGRTGPSSARTS